VPVLSEIDLITFQIISDSLEAIATEMAGLVERTGVHPLFQEVHDFSTGVLYYDGADVSLVARTAKSALPNHIFASIAAVRGIVARFGDDIHPGDVFIISDPYLGGNHNADWTTMTPVFIDERRFIIPSVRGHMSDFGGVVAGGYNPDARDIWQEGYRIPPVRLVSQGERIDDVWNIILANSRLAETLRGDLMALVGGCNLGARRVQALVDKYGVAVLERAIEHALDYTARRFRAEIAQWPRGTYVGERLLDHDSAGNHDILVRASITVEEERLVVDFEGSSAQSPGYINSVYGNTVSWVLVSLGVILPEDLKINSGILRQIDVVAPPGSVVNSLAPAPTMFSSIVIGSEIGDAVLKAFEQIAPERAGSAGLGYCLCTTFGRDARYDDSFYFTLEYGNTLTTAGGAYGTDGWGAMSTPHCPLVMANVETQELQFPFLFEIYEYAADSCAPGRWRGVPAFLMRRAITGSNPAWVNVTTEGYRHPLPGFVGGGEGGSSYTVLWPGSAREELVTESASNREMLPGEILLTFKGGGGGWGPAFERDPQAVLVDVLDGYVSRETARELYGVVVADSDGRLALDEEATRRLRAEG
jgi:N-methylhydantoinase B